MKYLIVGLGNIGTEYINTRHNVGFTVIDYFAKQEDLQFEEAKHAKKTSCKHKGRTFILIKPSTYVNRSGTAVNYWLQKEKIPVENLLVVLDDLALPFGKIRLRSKGSDGGHNGLKDIDSTIGHRNYARLRFGIGDNFQRGKQVEHVLGNWTFKEGELLTEKLSNCRKIIQSCGTIGIERTMSIYNNT